MNPVLLALLFPGGPASAGTLDDIWPQWRGPTHDSVCPSGKLPTEWSSTDHVVWKTRIPGQGNSSPVIWKDAVFVTTHDPDRLLVLRIDRASGKILWEREVGKGRPRRTGPVGNNRFHDENNMASPSPVTDGKHVWVHFGTGHLACYDFAGAHLWTINLTERFGPYTIWWGHANSPCLVGDVLISVCMQDPKGGGKSYVVAHDKLTGKEKWVMERSTGAKEEPADAYTTPVLFRKDGRTEVVVFGGNVMDAYDPANGKRLWQCRAFRGNRNISGPTVAGDTVIAVEGMKGAVFAVRAGGDGDVTETHIRWKRPGPTPDAASPVIANGLVFLATNSGTAICLDEATGKEVWKERLGDKFRATPLVAGNKIYFFTKEGKTVIVDAARTFHIVAECDLGEDTIASPAVAGGNLFIRTREHLYRIGGR
jgi:outer membrane protein assembly factor BamB